MGETCRKKSAPAPVHERDLFGFDIDKAVHAALYRLHALIESLAVEAMVAGRHAARDARVRRGVWNA